MNVTIGNGATVHIAYTFGTKVSGSLCNPYAWERSRVRVTEADANCLRCEKATRRATEEARRAAEVAR